jgi:hypothetical protein
MERRRQEGRTVNSAAAGEEELGRTKHSTGSIWRAGSNTGAVDSIGQLQLNAGPTCPDINISPLFHFLGLVAIGYFLRNRRCMRAISFNNVVLLPIWCKDVACELLAQIIQEWRSSFSFVGKQKKWESMMPACVEKNVRRSGTHPLGHLLHNLAKHGLHIKPHNHFLYNNQQDEAIFPCMQCVCFGASPTLELHNT